MPAYDLLLRLYPASFRTEYGDEMRAIWARRRRDASGPLAALLWIAILGEVIANAAAVHWDILRHDLRYTARTLARSPGFALTSIAVLALGVGANTAAFSVTDFVLIRPLPFPHSERLVRLWEKMPAYSTMELSPANYVDWKRMSKSFDGMGAYWNNSVNLVGQGDPERLESAVVTADLFPLLGARPVMGRLFTPAEDREGAPGTLLLSYSLWQAVFGGETNIIGRRVNLDNEPFEIIGVMPRDFHFPNRDAELWTPARFQEHSDDFQDRTNNYLGVVARLKPGVSVEQARAEMIVIAGRLERQYPKENRQTSATVYPLRDDLSPTSRLLLLALSGAAICVLLIACANLANLLLARGLSRERELAIRAAIGAGRERLVRQLMTESMVLALAGGALGMVVAMAAVPLLTKLVPDSLPIAQSPSIDLRVLLFAAGVSVITGLVFGVFPAMRSGRQAGFEALHEGSRAGGGRKERLRSALVAAEVAASIVLLASAGLLTRALWRIQATDPGFRGDSVLTLRTALPNPKYDGTSRRVEFYDRVLSGVKALPGVSSAAYITSMPMVWRGGIWPVTADGKDEQLERLGGHTASLRYVTPGFFATLGIPMLHGRDVSESDSLDSPWIAVVSESFVRQYWPNQDPLGRHFKMAFADRTVAGVVGDIRVRGLERSSEPQVYLCYRQVQDAWLTFYAPKDLAIRAARPAALLPAVRRIVHEADAEQPISDVRMMNDIVDAETASRVAQVRVLGAFAAIAFLLAGVGIHGLLSFAVSQRRREIGVRIALGARPGEIVRMVVRQAVWLACAGAVPGLVLAYAAGRALEGLLAGVRPDDALTLASAVALCAITTVLGSLVPAVRAVGVDPIAAIRAE